MFGDPSNPWPTILWLEGGPGGFGVGFGNFLEIKPLDVDLKLRNSTWLTKADLLFVDSPVGMGFSYVEDESLAVKTDEANFVFSWGPLLKDLSRLDSNALYSSNSLAQKIQQELAEEKYEDATNTLGVLRDVISAGSNDVDFYNFIECNVHDGSSFLVPGIFCFNNMGCGARSHAHDLNLEKGNVIGNFNGEFWGMFAGHQFVGNLMSLFLLKDGT
ncbi:unnamed protein product [Camellia sinensis]